MNVFLGIPTKRETVNLFRNHIWKRYTDKEYPESAGVDVQNIDRASAYMERVIDRLLNKARGILPFNSILLVIVIAIMNSGLEKPDWLINTTLAILLGSSIMALLTFLVHWGDVNHYGKIENEFDTTTRIIWIRSFMLQISVILSLVGVLSVAALGIV
jgi:hypothetical protein